jgi:uncharacterized membrane protein YgaE (UPF0421/DUF939 family)
VRQRSVVVVQIALGVILMSPLTKGDKLFNPNANLILILIGISPNQLCV